jgi:hydroxymethylpyrimidine/phosphomethylpyrimidine kinase
MDSNETPTVLTIAGSDSRGRAGIDADHRTFAAHGLRGVTALTAVTVQSIRGVVDVFAMPTALVAAQIDAAVAAFHPRAGKIGMLATTAIVETVAAAIDRHKLANTVLDPVMMATSGGRLLEEAAIDSLRSRLMPRVALVTPNLDEARQLAGFRVVSVDDMQQAAMRLVTMGARAVLVKGGHLDGPATDVFYDGRSMELLTSERVPGSSAGGTGCMLSSSIAARLARGASLLSAVQSAKDWLTGQLRAGRAATVGPFF